MENENQEGTEKRVPTTSITIVKQTNTSVEDDITRVVSRLIADGRYSDARTFVAAGKKVVKNYEFGMSLDKMLGSLEGGIDLNEGMDHTLTPQAEYQISANSFSWGKTEKAPASQQKNAGLGFQVTFGNDEKKNPDIVNPSHTQGLSPHVVADDDSELLGELTYDNGESLLGGEIDADMAASGVELGEAEEPDFTEEQQGDPDAAPLKKDGKKNKSFFQKLIKR